MATTAACCPLSSFGAGFGRGSSVSACCSPFRRYRFPTRDTSRGYPPTAIAVARTVWPASSKSST